MWGKAGTRRSAAAGRHIRKMKEREKETLQPQCHLTQTPTLRHTPCDPDRAQRFLPALATARIQRRKCRQSPPRADCENAAAGRGPSFHSSLMHRHAVKGTRSTTTMDGGLSYANCALTRCLLARPVAEGESHLAYTHTAHPCQKHPHTLTHTPISHSRPLRTRAYTHTNTPLQLVRPLNNFNRRANGNKRRAWGNAK